MKEENTDNKSASYLDLDCQIKDKTIVSKLFDKQDAFKNFLSLECPIVVAIFHLKCFIQL